MTFRVVRTNQYNQDLGLIHSTNGNHLESPNEGSSIDHQVTTYLHAQNIIMFPTNETWDASLIQNALQVNFDSVLSLSEEDLESFFSNTVNGDSVISCVQGKFVEITEEQFAGVFELPTEGLTSMDDVPKDLIKEARRAFSVSGELIKTSCKKKEMKVEFRLLNDIMAKTVTAKAGSFDAVTHERFLLMAAIHGGIKINWSKFFFDILKAMVTKSSNLAKWFAAQICVLLKGATDLTFGESKTFPPLKILTVKTVGTYIARNKSVSTSAEEVMDEPVAEKVVKAEAKRRPSPIVEPAAKKKRTTVGRSAPTEKTLEIVPMIREALVEEISSLFYSFSLLSLSDLTSISDLAEKEEQVLKWAETDSLQTAVRRRLYIIAKYREMLLRKLLEARHDNFESGTPTSAIDLQVLDLLSEAHSISLINLLEQLKQHRLEWTRPSRSWLFGGSSVQSGGIHSQFYPNVTSTSWRKPLPQRPFMDAFAPIYIFIEPVQDLDSRKPYSGIVQRLWAEICVDVVQFSLFGHLQPVGTFNMCRDIVVVDADLANETVPTGIFDSFQHGLNVEGFVDFFVQPDIQTFLPVLVQKVQCLSDPDLQIRLHPVLLPVLPEGLNTLRAQMSEIIAYINRRDEKRGKRVVGSPPDHRSRPSGGGRSSSEPSRKRGGSYRRRGSRSLGSNRWFS
ncbi:hypothetical protein F511_27251 [Dorcoceras hygrometricum]|uniref:Dystroglycan-like n=1 Tax=Dorcoceras hygrometricum TaxID=472368 RepID=A0A2Z7AUT8_9LAMI|nr:hypothetical protein F511_27251 [Dorcoceras hygrometricum]